MNNTFECPNCEAKLQLKSEPRLQQLVICPSCRGKYKIIQLSPLEFDCCDHEWEEYEKPGKTRPNQNGPKSFFEQEIDEDWEEYGFPRGTKRKRPPKKRMKF